MLKKVTETRLVSNKHPFYYNVSSPDFVATSSWSTASDLIAEVVF